MSSTVAIMGESSERFATTRDRMVCNSCHESIAGGCSAVKAGGKFWHQDHFICSECDAALQRADGGQEGAGNTVFQKDGKLFCELDYKQKFVPKCAFCTDFIMKVLVLLVIVHAPHGPVTSPH